MKPSYLPRFSIDWRSTQPSITQGLRTIVSSRPHRFSDEAEAPTIVFRPLAESKTWSITATDVGFQIGYARPCDAFRALGIALGGELPGAGASHKESCRFSTLGVMIDLSRHGVLRVEALERLLGHYALMGINMVQLYMEDVYQIEGEPFFGYARGAYSKEELRRIDDAAFELGIEIIPCIQTLGHLGQALQWHPYHSITDVAEVILVGEEGTYRLIAKMLDSVAACFRSRKIHIGMDEAHGVGQGVYRRKHGEQCPFEILTRHLSEVVTLCKERGLHPIIWSDMFFRLGSETNEYYDVDSKMPEGLAEKVPAEVDLVYWDYYHTDPAFYTEWIARHRSLGKEPIFAAGVWNWHRFWPYMAFVKATLGAGMDSAKDANLSEAVLTIWGDDGNECNPFSTLVAVQYFVECAYDRQDEPGLIAQRFFGSCEADYEAYELGSQIDDVPARSGEIKKAVGGNPGKWILWHDPVLNFLSHHIPGDLACHYEELASKLKQRLEQHQSNDPNLRFVALLSQILAHKCHFHHYARRYYETRDLEGLKALATETLPEIIKGMENLWEAHQAIWDEWYKPFGWLVLDARYAQVVSRLKAIRRLLLTYLDDPSKPLEVFGFELQCVYPESELRDLFLTYARTSRPTTANS